MVFHFIYCIQREAKSFMFCFEKTVAMETRAKSRVCTYGHQPGIFREGGEENEKLFSKY